MKIAISALVLAAAAGAANASIFFETEANNTMATANFVGAFGAPGEGILIDGSITPGTSGSTGQPGTAGDVDWFSFTVTGQTTFVASIFAIINSNGPGVGIPDSQLILTDAAGNILAADDDENVGFMSSLNTITLAAGTYHIGVTGYNDMDLGFSGPILPDGFDGTTQINGHEQNWTYKLIIGLNIVPTPGAAALLGLGGLAASRRRR